MAPTVRSSTRAKTTRTAKATKPRRAQYKKKQQQQIVERPKIDNLQKATSSSTEDLPSSASCTTTTTATTTTSSSDNFSKTLDHHHNHGLNTFVQASADNNNDNNIPSSGCSTPKAQRFRIPEIVTCPPAPKKQRVVSNCSLQRTPIAFFAPPDLELFFLFALHDISV